MTRHTVQKVVFVAATVVGLMVTGAGTALADHGDNDFGFDDHGRFDDRFFDGRGFNCLPAGPVCVGFDDHGRNGGRGRH